MLGELPWNDRPPAAKKLPHLPLIRLPAGGVIAGAMTVKAMIGINTHFWQRRTLPCVGEKCPACEDKRPQRWEGYVAIWTKAPSRHVIIALTPSAANELAEQLGAEQANRGRVIQLSRAGKRANGRLIAEALDEVRPEQSLPPEPQLREHLIHIWGLDQAQVGQDDPGYRARVMELYAGESGSRAAAEE